jgi:hypothetical protein
LNAIDTSVIHPNTLAIMQLRALQAVAAAPNSKLVVPYEAAGLLGAARVLVDALGNAGDPDEPGVVGNGVAPQAAN